MTDPRYLVPRPTRPLGAEIPAEPKPGWSEGIRALYDAVLTEPLPVDFLKLLDELGKKAPH